MRNISFALTTEQIRNRTKTVTRRTGWKNLKPGTLLCAVVKGMGLKKGEKVERLCTIRVIDVRRESLARMEQDIAYGYRECAREGFPEGPYCAPVHFIMWFARTHGIAVTDDVTRIEFEYV